MPSLRHWMSSLVIAKKSKVDFSGGMTLTTLNTSQETTDWKVCSLWVVKTIQMLVDRVELQSRDFTKLQERILIDLVKVREDLRVEFDKAQTEQKQILGIAVERLDSIIQGLIVRTTILESVRHNDIIDSRLSVLTETVLTPMRLKLTGLAAVTGAIGGGIFLLIIDMFKKLLAS